MSNSPGYAGYPPPPILIAEAVGKSYAQRGLISLLRGNRNGGGWRAATDGGTAVEALSGIELSLDRGSSLAVIGRNGAGKSTLLRLIAGISRPTRGRLEVRGGVRSLLDLGAGLLEDMTGRENAHALLGLDGIPSARRRALVEQALAFADVGRFVDEPVRAYSMGMRLRLAYALAIAVRPEILVADEVLAVGDEDFQRRCSGHVVGFLEEGGTLVLATHNLYYAEKLCQRAIWLERGRIAASGPVREVTAAYRAHVEAEEAQRHERGLAASDAPEPGVPPGPGPRAEAGRPGAGPADAAVGLESSATADSGTAAGARCGLHPSVRTPGGSGGRRVVEGEPLEIRIEPVPAGVIGLGVEIARLNGTCVAAFPVAGQSLSLAACPLLPGRYRIRLVDRHGRLAGPPAEAASELDCVGSSRELGTVRLAHRWG